MRYQSSCSSTLFSESTYCGISKRYLLKRMERFQIVQTKLDQMEVNIIPKYSTTAHDIQIIKERMQFFAGEGIGVTVNKVDVIPLPKSGKMRDVVSQIETSPK